VIAAMVASGVTEIENAEIIYRGHQAIERDLAQAGANIIRIDD
jgi:UDP-N-acetylglucosamine enolpyruvyl transferase